MCVRVSAFVPSFMSLNAVLSNNISYQLYSQATGLLVAEGENGTKWGYA